jgi:ABC-2 type transport system ATP-binding protein
MGTKDCARRIEHTLELFDLSDWGGSLIENFSHGMKQRLVFAAALLPRPRLLVVDEPMVGLDPRGARLVKTVFRQLRDEEKATVLLSTHTMQVAEELCDRISVIHKGQIIATGTLEELRRAARRADETANDLEAIFLILTREASRALEAPPLAESAPAEDAQAGPTEDSTP